MTEKGVVKASIAGLILLAGMRLASAIDRDGAMAGLIQYSNDGLMGFVNEAIAALLDFYRMVLLFNPEPAAVRPMADEFVKILLPVYVIAIMITGFYWLFLSISPRSRAKAKGMLIKLMVSMPLVLSSTAIFQFILDLSSLSVNFVFSLANVDLSAFGAIIISAIALLIAGAAIGAPIFLIFIFVMIVFMVGVSLLRYLFLFFMASIFPIAIFLLFFELTRDIGAKLMRYTLMFAFMPALQAFFIVFVITTLNGGIDISSASIFDAAAGILAVFAIVVGGCVMIIVSPFMMLGLMKWVGIGLVGWSYGNMGAMSHKFPGWGDKACIGLMFGGALLAGEGASSVALAGGLWFISQLGPHGHAGANQHHIIEHGAKRYFNSKYAVEQKNAPKPPQREQRISLWEPKSKKEHIKKAAELKKQGRYAEAIKQYGAAVRDNTGVAPITEGRMEDGFEAKRDSEVLSDTERKNALKSIGDCHVELAKSATDLETRRDHLRGATDAYGRSETFVAPGSDEAVSIAKKYSKIAANQEKIGDLTGASYTYDRAMQMDPNNPTYSYKKADILYKRK